MLNFVYNPQGAELPPDQHKLENEYQYFLKKSLESNLINYIQSQICPSTDLGAL